MNRRALGRRFVPAVVGMLFCGPFVHAITTPARAYPRPGQLQRLDVSTDGRSFQGSCGQHSSISANGRYVAFDTDAPLVENDLNQQLDVYLRDLKKGTTRLISVGLNGSPAIGTPDLSDCQRLSWEASITPDGRYIAFSSSAVNLVQGDTNGLADIFVYDRKKRAMERVSVSSKGEETKPDRPCPESGCRFGLNGHSTEPSISADGRYVSFISTASNLVPGDTNEFADVFVHDRRSGRTIRASVDSEGNESNPCPPPSSYHCYLTWGHLHASISLNGRYVAFHSRSPDLVPDDTNGIYDVFVHDVKTRRTERVSIASDGTEAQDLKGNRATGMSGWSGSTLSVFEAPGRVISANGRYVTFSSTATNLVPNDTNRHGVATGYSFAGGGDVFVHDRKTGRTERVSVTSEGREQNRCVEASACVSDQPSISADGRYVSFRCWWGCELSRDMERHSAIAVFDRRTGELAHIPMTKHGDAMLPGLPDLSPSGRYVSFASSYWYDGLVGRRSGDAMYLYDRGPAHAVGGLGGRREPPEEPGDDRICITAEVCIPPGGAFLKKKPHGEATKRLIDRRGAQIIAARLAYRPQLGDAYLRLDVSEMEGMRGTGVAGDPTILYGFRVELEDAVYEVRAAQTGAGSALQPAFGLFECESGICSEVAGLEGGYGTLGDNVVVALPLTFLGLEKGGRISRLTAFTAHGTYFAGDLAILDEVELR